MILAIDNFIKDPNLLREIKEDSFFFSDPGVYYYWKGWWDSPASTTKKKLIRHIWGENCPIRGTFEIDGFEYWTGIQTADASSGFDNKLESHFDKDEAWFEKTKELQTPLIGTVYYPEQEHFEGGMLEIYTNGLDSDPERIYAKSNRLIIFDAGTVPHRVDIVTMGTRKAIAINLWSFEPYSNQIGKLKTENK